MCNPSLSYPRALSPQVANNKQLSSMLSWWVLRQCAGLMDGIWASQWTLGTGHGHWTLTLTLDLDTGPSEKLRREREM
jgi:hypothetical protein